MNSASSMRRKWLPLLRPYGTALRRHLKGNSPADPMTARRLGRRAVGLGLDALDLAQIHEQAVGELMRSTTVAATRDRAIKRAGAFFAEAIVPMEETHRVAMDASRALGGLNRALSRRTEALAVSNRKLKREVARRAGVEQSLRQSEQRSGRLLKQSQQLQEQMRQLSRRILSTQEDERRKISRELHDVIAQVLTGINIRLAVLKTEATVNTRGLARNIARTQRMVERSVAIVHRFAYDLRPAVLDYLGLIPALDSFMKNLSKEAGLRMSLTAFAGANRLDSARRTALYRVAQEALTNVARHAQASRVEVYIRKLAGDVGMRITDNGRSFDVERMWHARKGRRLGLLGMRERVEMLGGRFTVESAPGKGTTVDARIPFGNGGKRRGRP